LFLRGGGAATGVNEFVMIGGKKAPRRSETREFNAAQE
jgi:hypothetical protein